MLLTTYLVHALPVSDRRCLSRREAASYIAVSVSYFDKLVADGIMPGPILFSRRRVWDKSDLDQAVEKLKASNGVKFEHTSGWDDLLS